MLVANDEFYESIDNSQQDEYDIVLKASNGNTYYNHANNLVTYLRSIK